MTPRVLARPVDRTLGSAIVEQLLRGRHVVVLGFNVAANLDVWSAVLRDPRLPAATTYQTNREIRAAAGGSVRFISSRLPRLSEIRGARFDTVVYGQGVEATGEQVEALMHTLVEPHFPEVLYD